MATYTDLSVNKAIVNNLVVLRKLQYANNPVDETYVLGSTGTGGQVSWVPGGGGGGSGYWSKTGTTVYYNSGNVGIGTSSGASALNVVGDIQLTGDMIFSEVNGFDIKDDSGTEIITIGTTGTVGIGTTTPGYKLTVAGDAYISGNLTVDGNQTVMNTTNLLVEDPLIKLADGNAADAIDIGLYGMYVNGTTGYSGFFRDATDSKWKLFSDLTEEPTTTVNTVGAGYTKGDLVVGDLQMTTVSNAPTFSGAYTTFTNSIRADEAVVIESDTTDTVSGTVSTTTGSTAVVGSGTFFTREIAVGDSLVVGVTGEIGVVESITDDSNLTVNTAFGSTSAGLSITTAHAPLSISTENSTNAMMVLGSTGWLGVGLADPTYPLHVEKTHANNWSGLFKNGSTEVKLAYEDTKGIDVSLDDSVAERAAYTASSQSGGVGLTIYSNGRIYADKYTSGPGIVIGVTGDGTGIQAGNAMIGPDRASANNDAAFYNYAGTAGKEAIIQDVSDNTTINGANVILNGDNVFLTSGGGAVGVTGTLNIQDINYTMRSVSDAAFSLLDSDTYMYYIFTHASPTVTLYAANSATRRPILLIYEGSGSMTVQRAGLDTIDGVSTTSFVLNQYERVRLLNNGTSIWYTI